MGLIVSLHEARGNHDALVERCLLSPRRTRSHFTIDDGPFERGHHSNVRRSFAWPLCSRSVRIALVLLTATSPARADGDANEPSRFRVYAGPILWVPFEANNFDIFALGGTVAFQYYPERHRVFFFGGRLAFLGDPQGIGYRYVGGFADAEVGVRPRLVARGRNAFALVLSGGVGGEFISALGLAVPTTGFVHLSLRAGLGFDLGAFTMDAIAGPTMFANGDGAAGAVEALVEVGIRF